MTTTTPPTTTVTHDYGGGNYDDVEACGRSSTVEHDLAEVDMGVRLSPSARWRPTSAVTGGMILLALALSVRSSR